jgi:hypothetical protein
VGVGNAIENVILGSRKKGLKKREKKVSALSSFEKRNY